MRENKLRRKTRGWLVGWVVTIEKRARRITVEEKKKRFYNIMRRGGWKK